MAVPGFLAAIGGGKGLAEGLGGITGALGSLLGSQKTGTSYTEFRPEDIQAIRSAQTTYQQMVPGLLSDLEARQKAVLTGVQAPSREFAFSQQADPLTRAMASMGSQQLGEQASAQRQAIASQFRGQPGLSNVLQAQANIQSRLQQNPLLFQAFQQQQGRELAQAQQQLAQQEAANQAIMGREQLGANLAMMRPQAQASLLNTLFQLGQGFGKNVSKEETQGLLGRIFG